MGRNKIESGGKGENQIQNEVYRGIEIAQPEIYQLVQSTIGANKPLKDSIRRGKGVGLSDNRIIPTESGVGGSIPVKAIAQAAELATFSQIQAVQGMNIFRSALFPSDGKMGSVDRPEEWMNDQFLSNLTRGAVGLWEAINGLDVSGLRARFNKETREKSKTMALFISGMEVIREPINDGLAAARIMPQLRDNAIKAREMFEKNASNNQLVILKMEELKGKLQEAQRVTKEGVPGVNKALEELAERLKKFSNTTDPRDLMSLEELQKVDRMVNSVSESYRIRQTLPGVITVAGNVLMAGWGNQPLMAEAYSSAQVALLSAFSLELNAHTAASKFLGGIMTLASESQRKILGESSAREFASTKAAFARIVGDIPNSITSKPLSPDQIGNSPEKIVEGKFIEKR
ncbi:hypothetical protein KKD37_01200 [Patescibacteria group bacterium]|nr:hypothetical protein [Patescibacteria group bacterium]